MAGSGGPRRVPRRVVVVGGGASGTLVATRLLERAGPGTEVCVLEPREALGLGVAYGTRDPWHRVNFPAAAMSIDPDDAGHFARWAGIDPLVYPSRLTWGRYAQAALAAAEGASRARLVHRRARAAAIEAERSSVRITTDAGDEVDADAVVIATGNEIPAVPGFLAGLVERDDPRLVLDPWTPGALDAVADGETAAVLGTGLTAIDVTASLVRRLPAVRIVMVSRHGLLPRPHEDPWRPRPETPAMTLEEFRAAPDQLAAVEARIAAHPLGWRQGLDSLRPLHVPMWLAMDDATRRRFLGEWRRRWEVHRSRVDPAVIREVEAWVAAGRVETRATPISGVEAGPDGRLVIATDAGPIRVERILSALGPDERAAASPFLATGIAAGVLREGPHGLGIDADPVTLRALDASGAATGPIWALGPVLRGVLFETIAIPEIRVQAATIAEGIATRLLAGDG